MKNRFLYLPRILFLKSLLLSIIFGFFAFWSPTFNLLVLFASFTSILIFQFFIVLSEFKIQIKRIVWPLSYLLGLSLLFNLSKEWLFISWKYQLIVLVFSLLSLFNLRFISSMNKWVVVLAFFNSILYSIWLVILVRNNFNEDFYFDLAKIFTGYMILFTVIISIADRKATVKAENNSTG